MNAQEAKNRSEKSRKVSRTKVDSLIQKSADEGDTSCQYQLAGMEAKFADVLVESLRSDGFTVKRNTGYDQRDGDGWDYLAISW